MKSKLCSFTVSFLAFLYIFSLNSLAYGNGNGNGFIITNNESSEVPKPLLSCHEHLKNSVSSCAIGTPEKTGFMQLIMESSIVSSLNGKNINQNDISVTGTVKDLELGTNLTADVEAMDSMVCGQSVDKCMSECLSAAMKARDGYKDSSGSAVLPNPEAFKLANKMYLGCQKMGAVAISKMDSSMIASLQGLKLGEFGKLLSAHEKSDSSGVTGMIKDNPWIAVGGAAVVAGGLAYKMGKDKGKKSGYKKGLNDGLTAHEEVCFKQGKWDTPECKDEYLLACKDDPKREGCYAFTNTYCGMGGAKSATATGQGTTYCDEMAEHRYCESAGNANSPSCVENRIQSGVCQQQKANNPDLICQMYAHQQLAESICEDFPNDPKCLNIIISNQGKTAANQTTSGTGTQSTVVPVINTNTTSTSSTSTQSTSPSSGTVVRQADGSYIVVYGTQSGSTQFTGGSTTVQSYGDVGLANSNLLQNLTIDISSACNQGTLVGCYQSPSFR